MRSIFRISRCLWPLALLCVGSLASAQSLPTIRVIYPKAGQTVGAVDSSFVFGHLPTGLGGHYDEYVVAINDGPEFPVHREGGWIAFVPVSPGEFTFSIKAFNQKRAAGRAVAEGSVTVNIPLPLPPLRPDSIQILGDFQPPQGDITLRAGDLLTVSFRGTPGMSAWCSIPGVVDSVPMAETAPRAQTYWGESAFGAGGIPDSLLLRGIYSGFYSVPERVRILNSPITYNLGLSESAIEVMEHITEGAVTSDIGDSTYFGMRPIVTHTSGYRVSLNDPAYPFTVRFVDSVQTVRVEARRGYFSIFQPEGVEALAVGAEGDWYRLKLSHAQFAWAAKGSVEALPKGVMPAKSYLRVIRTYSSPDDVRVEFPLAGRHPFQIVEDDAYTIRVRLFGVISDTDWIRYDATDSLVEFIVWSQPEPAVYEATIRTTRPIWGYDTYYTGNRFYLQLNRPPNDLPSIKGKRIVLDPGHSADPGAVGPTGYTEAEANLEIALTLAELLQHRGADVIMTRTDASHVALYERPTIAKLADADLFVSIHNNALPDGVNPFVNFGTSSYYYHLHSLPLARAIHRRMLEATGLPDHGFYHGNLAVNRPTQYPAVLVECAFMILPQHEAMLKTKQFRITVAHAIAAGIDDFLKEYGHD